MKPIFVQLMFVLSQSVLQVEACVQGNTKTTLSKGDLSYMDPEDCQQQANGKMWNEYDPKIAGGYIRVHFILAKPNTKRKTNVLVVDASSLFDYSNNERDLSKFTVFFDSSGKIIPLDGDHGTPVRHFIHQQYKAGDRKNDVALLKLPKLVSFPKGVNPECVSDHSYSAWIKEHARAFAEAVEASAGSHRKN